MRSKDEWACDVCESVFPNEIEPYFENPRVCICETCKNIKAIKRLAIDAQAQCEGYMTAMKEISRLNAVLKRIRSHAQNIIASIDEQCDILVKEK